MNRQEAKQETRKKILTVALREFTDHGYQGANTARIAKEAGVAHGTIFLHFSDKDQLLFEVIRSRLVIISNRLYEAVHHSKDIATLCRIHLDYLNEEVAFEAMLARETPLLPMALQRQVFTIRCGIVGHFHQAISQGIENGTIRKVNPTVALHVWFGTLNYYLANQHLFASPGEIIREKGEALLDYFLTTIRR